MPREDPIEVADILFKSILKGKPGDVDLSERLSGIKKI